MARREVDFIHGEDDYGQTFAPLVVRHAPPVRVPAFVPTSAYAGVRVSDLPAAKSGPEEKSFSTQIALDNVDAIGLLLVHRPIQAIETGNIKEQKNMTLTYVKLSRNGKNAFYSGAAIPFRIPLSAFPGKTAPQTIEVTGEPFAPARQPKAKLTKEERAALPKPTLAEKIAKREKALADLKAKAEKEAAAAKANAPQGDQPSL